VIGSWRIFLYDIKKIATNWVAAILIIGLTILPSLYAWFNIKASWDPYGQTNQIPVGIVNEDKGAIVRGHEIHVGDELVSTLKEKKSMDWKFVNREIAMEKLEYGEYFSVLIIPEDFSERLATVISDDPKKADVDYYVNEKINAIAPKITEKGASVIVEQISSKFISTVNGIIFEIFNDLGIELEENLPDIKKFEDYIFILEEKLPEIQGIINDTIVDAEKADNLIIQAQALIPEIEEATASGLQTIDNTTRILQEAEDRLAIVSPKIDEHLTKAQNTSSQINQLVNSIDPSTIDLSEGNQISNNLIGQINDTLQSISIIKNNLNQIQKVNNPNDESFNDQGSSMGAPVNNQGLISNTISELDKIENKLQDLQVQANEINSFIEDKQSNVNQFLSDIKGRTGTISQQLDAFVKEFKETIEPTVREEVASAKEKLANARSILVEIQSMTPDVENILSRTKSNLSKGRGILNDVSGEIPYVNDKIKDLADKIRQIQGEADINEIIQLLENNPEEERSFFAEPVVLNETKLFPIPNYGTAMTPFYTVLAIWVGGLLLISLLSTDVSKLATYTKRQIYFGRLFTFLSIGIFQTLIVTLGNILILKVEVKEPFWFILFGLLCSTVFILIVYTLVSVFGDVGKASAIVLLVLQISGSGGTYPVVLLPKFFQLINPFLPFTYAIDLMREAVGGIVWSRVLNDVIFIVLFGAVALFIGVFLKELINKRTRKLKQKSSESGLFH